MDEKHEIVDESDPRDEDAGVFETRMEKANTLMVCK